MALDSSEPTLTTIPLPEEPVEDQCAAKSVHIKPTSSSTKQHLDDLEVTICLFANGLVESDAVALHISVDAIIALAPRLRASGGWISLGDPLSGGQISRTDVRPFVCAPVFIWAPSVIWPEFFRNNADDAAGLTCPGTGCKLFCVATKSMYKTVKKVHGLNFSYYAISSSACCDVCQSKSGKSKMWFQAWDPAAVEKMPKIIQDRLKFRISYHGGLDLEVLNLLQVPDANSAMIERLLKENREADYWKRFAAFHEYQNITKSHKKLAVKSDPVNVLPIECSFKRLDGFPKQLIESPGKKFLFEMKLLEHRYKSYVGKHVGKSQKSQNSKIPKIPKSQKSKNPKIFYITKGVIFRDFWASKRLNETLI